MFFVIEIKVQKVDLVTREGIWNEDRLKINYSADHKFLQNSFGFLLAYLTMSSLNLTVQ